MLYLDTSVLVAFYLPEPRNVEVQKMVSAHRGIAISPLSEVEFHSAVARRVRMGELSKDDALEVFSQFRIHVDDALYRIFPVEQRDYALARDWLVTFRTPLRTLDALHLAIALSNGLTVVTADKVLSQSAAHFGVKHRLLA